MGLRQLLHRCAAGRAYAALCGISVVGHHAAGLPTSTAASSAATTASLPIAAVASQWQSTRAYGKAPSEAGGPPKGYSSFKRRFKLTGSGAIRAMSPGFVHKRFNKSNKRLNRLSQGILVPPSYEKMMKQLGFTSRKF
jgi:ribosomal protein L35